MADLKTTAYGLLLIVLMSLFQACLVVDWMTRRLEQVWHRVESVESRMQAWQRSFFSEVEEE